jgi:hypothetical protein
MKIPTIDEDGLLEMIKTRPSAAAAATKPAKLTTPKASKHFTKTEPEPVVKKLTTPPKVKTESPASKKSVSGSQSSHISSPGGSKSKGSKKYCPTNLCQLVLRRLYLLAPCCLQAQMPCGWTSISLRL